ncbi:MAG: hypothetical protein Q8L81_03610 [Bacteroidota bacterium]|nr:hypothetical protein [Bacteroidota bacterium]
METIEPDEEVTDNENYWKLIGEKGKIIDDREINDGRVLVLFENDLNYFGVENHNPVKNSLWIKKSDLKLIL